MGVEGGDAKETEGSLGIEDCVPFGAGNKPFWARGVDMLGYSLNSFRTANLEFKDTVSPRMSRLVRLQMNAHQTARILSVSQFFRLLFNQEYHSFALIYPELKHIFLTVSTYRLFYL